MDNKMQHNKEMKLVKNIGYKTSNRIEKKQKVF